MSKVGPQRIVASSASVDDGTTKVKVLVRIRPFLGNEVGHDKCVLAVDEEKPGQVLLHDPRRPDGALQYAFDHCYTAAATQEEIFKQEIDDSLGSLFKGVNTTIFCTGMTGAGKTHTMQGTREDPGVIPRTVRSVLDQALARPKIKATTQHSTIVSATETSKPKVASPELEPSCHVYMSYFEIYNEKVYDLLEPKDTDCPVREDVNRRIVIAGLKEALLTSYSDFSSLYEVGVRNRKTAATKLNHVSSRSHALLLLKVKTIETDVSKFKTAASSSAPSRASISSTSQATQKTFEAKLHLIDLAGNEDNRKTDNRGARMTESVNINSSLLALAKVVQALNDGEKRIPYRESKLTRLLQDSLGGHSVGIMIANVAPGLTHFLNTYNTLNFATKSRQVVNNLQTHSAITYEEEPLPAAQDTTLTASAERKKMLEAWKEQRGRSTSYAQLPSSKLGLASGAVNSPSSASSSSSPGASDATTAELRNEIAKLQREHQQYKEQKQAQTKITESFLVRIAQLEHALIERQEQTAAEKSVPSVLPTMPGNATPCTKTKLIHSKIATAKNMEIIDPTEALRLYSEILSTLRTYGSDYKEVSIKIQARIDKLLAQCMDAQDTKRGATISKAPTATRPAPPAAAPSHPTLTSRASQPVLVARKPLTSMTSTTLPKSTINVSARPSTISSAATQRNMVARNLFAKEGKENSSSVPNRITERATMTKKRPSVGEVDAGQLNSHEDDEFVAGSESDSDDSISETPVKRPAKKRKLEPTVLDRDREVATCRSTIAKELGMLDESAQQEVDNILEVLNTGDAKRIMALHGIGKVRAEQIAEYSSSTPFNAIEELIFAGIGSKLILNLVRRNIVDAAYLRKMKSQPGASLEKPLMVVD